MTSIFGPLLGAYITDPGQLTTSEVMDSQLHEAIQFRPDFISIRSDANDIMKKKWSPTTFTAQMEHLINSIASLRTSILLLTLPAFPFIYKLGQSEQSVVLNQILELNEIVRSLSRYSTVYIFDVNTIADQLRTRFWSKDDLHPNADGYAFLGNTIYQHLSGT